MHFDTKENIFGLTKLYTEIKFNFAFFNSLKIDLDCEYKKSIDVVMKFKDDFGYLPIKIKYINGAFYVVNCRKEY